jgi:hypothetical protein
LTPELRKFYERNGAVRIGAGGLGSVASHLLPISEVTTYSMGAPVISGPLAWAPRVSSGPSRSGTS